MGVGVASREWGLAVAVGEAVVVVKVGGITDDNEVEHLTLVQGWAIRCPSCLQLLPLDTGHGHGTCGTQCMQIVCAHLTT